MPANHTTYIFDFDSTIIQVEALDILAKVGLANHPKKDEQLAQVQNITKMAMEGRYSYQESLSERFALLNLTSAHLEQAIEIIKEHITPSIERNKDFFKNNADNIYILSGAFIEIVWPIVQMLGIKRHHVFANRLLYDFESSIIDYDRTNPLAHDQGKVVVTQMLNLKGNVVVVGDGYTDYEIKANGAAHTFVAFTENVARESVTKNADIVVDELEGLFISCQIPYINKHSHKKVLLLENIHPFVQHFFKNAGFEVENLPNALNENELINKLQDVSILGIRSKTEVTSTVIEKCPTLEAIGAFCIGTNQINLATCSQQGIAVFNAPYSNTRSVVELALGEIILLVRRAISMDHKMRNNLWDKSSKGAHEVRGKTLGIIGYGNIGSQLSILAEAVGLRVHYYDIEDKLPLGNAKVCHTLEDLLNSSDIVTVHVDGRKENEHFIGKNEFAMMKDGAIFLNLSRGFVVDFAAMVQALESKKLSGVGVDVYPEEPHGSNGTFQTPLQKFDNVFLTPHIGGSTEEAQQNIGEYVTKNLHTYSMDGSSIGSVNFPQLNLPSMNYPQRIIHIHKNVPGILAKINSLFAEHETNIEGQFLKTNQDIGYVITDINQEIEDTVLGKLQSIPHTIKVRILNKSS
ncbi:MAG: phosphoglycerate dehydrogenase [Proteobacteria bacterium]|nr:phosphoglycerate dehydrogenase [Pseudomonadota bacterium]